ncbi:MAG TPA: flagellar biosynthetic protein FliR [Xanthobacteraceae bacterium]|nr:flagellar biosynthetic protein FliR [Xanthobacteraceae bacterium]
MTINLNFLPSLAAVFLLMFARLGTMVMLMPGLGEQGIPTRVRLVTALLLTLVMLPLHQAAYSVDITKTFAPLVGLFIQEMMVGVVLGLTARVALSALQIAGATIAQQLGLGFVTSFDPTQGQQGVLVGNFLAMLGVTLIFATDMHHIVIAALDDSYRLFQPGASLPSGDVAELMLTTVGGAFRVGVQIAAPFLVFGLLFNVGLGILARLMPQLQVFFLGLPVSIMIGFALLTILSGALMTTFLGYIGAVLGDLVPR